MRRALLVGIDDYDFGRLEGCVADVNRLLPLLQRNFDGSPNFDCQTLVSSEGNVTRAAIRERVKQLFTGKAEVALLYFAGHGVTNDYGGCLVTQDATSYDEGISMNEILTYLQSSDNGADECVVILDCCESGSLGNQPGAGAPMATLRLGTSFLTATGPREAAIENSGGIFTGLLCDALDGGAADVIGVVTSAGVYAYVDQALSAWEQRPQFKAHLARMSRLRRCLPSVGLETLRRLPDWFPNADAEYGLTPAHEPDLPPGDPELEEIFGRLQECARSKVVVPVGEEHMYYAAANSKACQLTALGRHYWTLAKAGRI